MCMAAVVTRPSGCPYSSEDVAGLRGAFDKALGHVDWKVLPDEQPLCVHAIEWLTLISKDIELGKVPTGCFWPDSCKRRVEADAGGRIH